ncbi:MAG: choice-of-anchor V domain-containing protein [Usitatibacteraceae bacterium]
MGIATLADASSGGITGRTVRDGSLGCTTACHSGSTSGTVTVTTAGPTSLAPGQIGNYTVTNNSDLNVASRAAGVNIASSDGVLTPAGNLASAGATEMYHSTPNLTNASGDTVFSFSWTMPGGAGVGSGHTIYATGRVWFSGNWNHAANFGITTAAPLSALVNGSAAPGSIAVGGTGSLSTSGGAGSGALSYVPSNSGICSVAGTTVTAVSVGTCTITATKAADSQTSVLADAVSFSIVQATQTITFPFVAPKLASAAPFGVSATGGGSGNPITYAATGVCTNAGAIVTLTGSVGTCTVTANQAGNANYLAAPPAVLNISVVASGEPFPPNCQIPLGWTTTAGANAGWLVATDSTFGGAAGFGNARTEREDRIYRYLSGWQCHL